MNFPPISTTEMAAAPPRRCFLAPLVVALCLVISFSSVAGQPSPPPSPPSTSSSVFNLSQQQLDLAEVKLAISNTSNYFLKTFLARHNKTYSVAELQSRLDIFDNTLTAIKQSHDDFTASGNTTYWLKITPFTDMTPAEVKQSYTGLIGTVNTSTSDTPTTTRRRRALATSPGSVDWRQASFGAAVTSVKNQGSCDDCWAFSTSAAVETSAAIKSSTPAVSLSEMQVLNCAPTTGGCSSGNTLPGGFQYYQGNGVTTYTNFPYTATNSKWAQNSGCTQPAPLTNITKFTNVQAASVSAMQTAAATTAVSVAICSTTINNYGGGLITSAGICAGCSSVDHAVVVVGYSTSPSGADAFSDSTSNYWIVKNSWGTSWGDSGYAYFAMSGGRSSSSLYGPCQILQEPIYVQPSAVNVLAASGGQSPAPSGSNTGTTTLTPSPSPSPQAAGQPPQFGALLLLVAALMVTMAFSSTWL